MDKPKEKDASEKLSKPDVLDLRDRLLAVKDKIRFLIDCFCQDGTPFTHSPTGQTGLYHILDEITDELERIEEELGIMQNAA